VVQFMANQTIVFGEIEGALSERALALETLLDVPGIDVRASEAYRRQMVSVLTRRALEQALEAATCER